MFNVSVITYESLISSTPFENNVEVFELRGEHIEEMLEFSIGDDPYPGARMLQVSGSFCFSLNVNTIIKSDLKNLYKYLSISII